MPPTEHSLSTAAIEAPAISEGASVARSVTFTEEMLKAFEAITGDGAPVHFDADFARSLGFKGRLVHGLLLGSIYSEMLGCQLPGPTSVIQKVSLDMVAPAYVDDTIDFKVTVSRVSEAVGAVSLMLLAHRTTGEIVCRGTAVCVLRK